MTKIPEKARISLDAACWSLAKVWMIGAGTIFFVLVLQSMLGKYGGKAEDVWAWVLPVVLPTLSLIITVLGTRSRLEHTAKIHVQKNFYLLALGLSITYLFLILGSIALEPFTSYEPIELLKLSNLWLGPFQGLVASAMGVLFFTQDHS